jgi:transcriptional regulator with XRE-family HTH domain
MSTQLVNSQNHAQALQDVQHHKNSVADPVMAHVCSQLDPAGCVATEDEQDGESLFGLKTKSGLALKLVIGRRINAAREMSGLTQGELAQALGFTNGTQLCLWEQGRRLPPLHFISLLSTAMAVSTDWLMGLDDAPERDSATAARNAVVRRMSDMLERHAGAVADVLLEAGRFDAVPELRNSQIVSKVSSLCHAVEKFRNLNPNLFDDAKAGAMLLRTAKDAREAVDKMAGLLDASDRRIEFALEQGRLATGTNFPS